MSREGGPFKIKTVVVYLFRIEQWQSSAQIVNMCTSRILASMIKPLKIGMIELQLTKCAQTSRKTSSRQNNIMKGTYFILNFDVHEFISGFLRLIQNMFKLNTIFVLFMWRRVNFKRLNHA